MLNLNAPIIPGQSAAGVRLGQTIDEIVATTQPTATIQLHDSSKLCFEYVNLWVKGNRVTQIGVSGKYQGTINGSVGIGSSIRDIQNTLGQVVEDEEDNLTVPSISGWCFETEQWQERKELARNLDARVTEILVYASRV